MFKDPGFSGLAYTTPSQSQQPMGTPDRPVMLPQQFGVPQGETCAANAQGTVVETIPGTSTQDTIAER